ncbi:MAG: hypothetical protein AAFX03_09335 [Pseudomonadota bacterium]
MTRTTKSRSPLLALMGAIAVVAVSGNAAAQSTERLARADANGDGAIEWQEMLDMRSAAFERLDRNSDGFADANDSPRFGPGKSRFGEALAQIQDADADGDGRISRTEMMEAPAPMFDEGDADGDKVLSAEELTALREAKKDTAT